MENSVLSDAAGIQKNISKMYEDYAKQIGKSTETLTQAEKAQAVYNGIMEEATMFTGSAAEMASGYQGVQAQLSASNLEFSRTIGESMIPALTQYNSLQLSITKGLTEFIDNHKGATSGVITFTATLLAMIVGLTAAKKAYISYKNAAATANMTTKAFTASLLTNPVTLLAVGIATVVAGITVFNTKMQESIDKMNEATEESKNLLEALSGWQEDFTYTEAESDLVKKERDEAQQIVQVYEEKKNKIEALENEINQLNEKGGFLLFGLSDGELYRLEEAKKELNKLNREQEKFEKENLSNGQSIENYRRKLEVLGKTLDWSSSKQEYARLTNQKAHRETLVNIAQTKADIDGKQKLLNILKKGKTTTDEYANAKSQLVKVYPELANVNENTITSTQDMINAESAAAEAEWANAQLAIQASILEVNAMMSNSEQIKTIAAATQQSVEQVTQSLQTQMNVLSNLANLTPDDFKGSVTTNYTPKVTKSSGSKSYSNKKLDNYKELIEYKKSLDKISLQEEIKMYQTALNKYAKTTSEKRELRTKIYELEKELNEKTLSDYTSKIEHKVALDKVSAEKEIEMYKKALKEYAKTKEEKWELEEKIYELEKELQEENLDNYKSKLEHKKALNKLSLEEELKQYQYAYKKLAKTQEQKWELEEKIYDLKEQLSEQETQNLQSNLDKRIKQIEDNAEKKEKIEGASYDIVNRQADYNRLIKAHQQYLDEILKSDKITYQKKQEIYKEELETIKSYEEQKRNLLVSNVDNTVSQLKDAIIKKLEEMEEADKNAIESNIELVEKWKEARINAVNKEYNARIEAIQKELDLLDKSEEEKTRAEEDAEYERKRNRLQELIDFEHDATTKANYQKELDKLITEHQKTLDSRALEDKKEALKEQQDLLKEQQSQKVEDIEDEADRQKEQLEEKLDGIEKYYKKQQDLAQQTAEKMLLNVDSNQQQILSLLKTYGDEYELTGQTLGEKLAQGIDNGLAGKITNAIHKIQDTIDANLESKIKSWTSTGTQTIKSATGATSTRSVSVTQNNYIQQNPEMPSETYRKLKNIDEALAAQLSGA